MRSEHLSPQFSVRDEEVIWAHERAEEALLGIFQHEFPEETFSCVPATGNERMANEQSSSLVRTFGVKKLFRKATTHQECILDITTDQTEVVVAILEPRLQESTLFICKVMHFLGVAFQHHSYRYRIDPDTIRATDDLTSSVRYAPLVPIWK